MGKSNKQLIDKAWNDSRVFHIQLIANFYVRYMRFAHKDRVDPRESFCHIKGWK